MKHLCGACTQDTLSEYGSSNRGHVTIVHSHRTLTPRQACVWPPPPHKLVRVPVTLGAGTVAVARWWSWSAVSKLSSGVTGTTNSGTTAWLHQGIHRQSVHLATSTCQACLNAAHLESRKVSSGQVVLV